VLGANGWVVANFKLFIVLFTVGGRDVRDLELRGKLSTKSGRSELVKGTNSLNSAENPQNQVCSKLITATVNQTIVRNPRLFN
jgi:hypothetical protein